MTEPPSPAADATEPAQAARRIRSFVRREGRMTDAQKRALQDLWPRYGLSCDSQPLDFAAVFGNSRPVLLEIGFGMGASLAQMAKTHPDNNYLGIEVHRPGVGTLLRQLAAEQLENVRVMDKDAVEIVSHCIAGQSLAGIYILFPDPWMKTRHHKRRLVQAPFMELLRDRLRGGGFIHLATDWQEYAQHMQTVMGQIAGLRALSAQMTAADGANGRPLTKYESRGHKLGHQVWDLVYLRAEAKRDD